MSLTWPSAQRLLELYQGRETVYAIAHLTGENGERRVEYAPVRQPLTVGDLERHLEGKIVVGVYPLRSDSSCRFGAIDVDAEDEEDLGRDRVRRLHEAAKRLGFPESAMLASFSGRKGHHLDAFFAEPIAAGTVRLLLQAVEMEAGFDSGSFEIFPKQDHIDPDVPTNLGNLIKLPLGTHPLTGMRAEIIIQPNQVQPATAELVFRILSGVKSNGPGSGNGRKEPRGPAEPSYPKYHRTKRMEQLAGILNREGVALEAAEQACLRENQDHCRPPLDLEKVLETVHGIYRRYVHEHRQGPGARRSHLGEAAESSEPSIAGDLDVQGVPQTFADGLPTLPEQLWKGWVRDFRSWVEPTTDASWETMFAAATTLIGLVAGRQVAIWNGRQVYANLFTLVVGRSGVTRKTTVESRLMMVLDALLEELDDDGPDDFLRILSGLASGPGLLEQFCREVPEGEGKNAKLSLVPIPGQCVLAMEDEFTSLLHRIDRPGTADLQEALMTLHDGHGKGNPTRQRAIPTLRQPFLSLFGVTTPMRLQEALKDDFIGSGFLPRHSVFYARLRPPKADPDRPDWAQLETLVQQLLEIRRAVRTGWGGDYRRPRILGKTRAASALWLEIHAHYHQLEQEAPELLANMLARIPERLHKFALIYALQAGHSAIEEDDLATVAPLGEYWRATSLLLCRGIGKSILGREEEKLLLALKRVHPKWVSPSAIHHHVSGRIDGLQLRRTLESLVALGLIESQEPPVGIRGRRPSALYRWVSRP